MCWEMEGGLKWSEKDEVKAETQADQTLSALTK